MPELNGKLDGYAIRVPTINVSIVDLTFIAARDTTVDEVNAHHEGRCRRRAEGHARRTTPRRSCPSTSTTTRARRSSMRR